MEIKQIVLTEKCNLNCEYCYIEQKENMMSEETFIKIHKTFVDDYQIDLFGGEPLINWSLIKFIIEKCKSDSRCHQINLYSNGLLLDREKVDYLKEQDLVNFFWSYDGLWAEDEIDPEILKLVKELTTFVAVQIGPPNLNIVNNYTYFINRLQMTPTFTLMKDKRWTPEDVLKFRQEFKILCQFFINAFNQGYNYMPKIIYMTLKRLIAGLSNRDSLPWCGAGVRMIAYMPNGEIFPCARFGTEGLNAGYIESPECQDCDINFLCDKGCYHQVVKYGVLKEICELNRIVLTAVIEMNHRLKDNRRWKTIIKQIEREALCSD